MANWLIFLLLVASRVFFIDGSKDFFDAAEYIQRTHDTSILSAISSGHPPFHPLYILLANLTFKLLTLFNSSNPALAITLVSAIFGSLSVVFFYYLIKKLMGQKIAILAAIIISILPFFWISNITILVDPSGLFFLILSMYLYWLGLNTLKPPTKITLIIASGFSYGACLMAHTSFGIWLPIFLGLFISKELIQKNWQPLSKNLLMSFLILVGPLISLAIYIYLLIHNGFSQSISEALRYLLIGNINDRMSFDFTRWLFYLASQVTIPLIILSVLAIVTMIWKKKKEIVLFIFWIAPSFIASTYIYENLHGRALLPLSFAIAALSAYTIYLIKNKFLRGFVAALIIISTLLVSLPAVISYGTKIAVNETLPQLTSNLSQDGILIGTNTMRTWNNYGGLYERLGDVDVGTGTVLADIQASNANNKPVYLTSDAIFYPYWRYDGQFFDLRSFPNFSKDDFAFPLASEFFEDYQYDLQIANNQFKKYILKLTQTKDLSARIQNNLDHLADHENLIIGRLVDPVEGGDVARSLVRLFGAQNQLLKENILSNDIFYRTNHYLNHKNDPLIWTISDNQGFFVLPTNNSITDEQLTVTTNPYNTRLKNESQFFTEEDNLDISQLTLTKKLALSKEALLKEISRISPKASFYLKKIANSKNFDLVIFDLPITRTNRLEAEDLAHLTGKIVSDNLASANKVVVARFATDSGFLTAGPYITLPAGSYQLRAKVKIDQFNPDKNDFGQIEIVARGGRLGIGSRQFTQNDLPKFQDFQTVTIEFNLPELTQGVEFRTRASGHAGLYLDYFELNKMN